MDTSWLLCMSFLGLQIFYIYINPFDASEADGYVGDTYEASIGNSPFAVSNMSP